MSDVGLGALLREVAGAQRASLQRPSRPSAPGALKARLAAVPVGGDSWTRSPFGWRGPGLLASGALALAVVALAAVAVLRPRPLSFTVADRPGRAGQLLDATGVRRLGTPIVFSDGSTIAVGALAELEVVEVDARGALVRLDGGEIDVSVRHLPRARWRFRSGPFEVNVTGTRFALGWDPGERSMSVDMHEGSVEVRSEGRPGFIAVRGGQRLVMRDGGVEWKLAPAHGPATAGLEPAPAPAVAAAPAATASAPPAAIEPAFEPVTAPALPVAAPAGGRPPAAGRGGRVGWRGLAASGRYRDALVAVEREGFGDACQRLGAEELVLLGDVARLASDGGRAERAYRAARRRFPRLDRPVFTLGLVAFEQRHDFAGAARWFEAYLAEFPRGPLANEAAGRALEAWQRAGQRAQARRAAAVYLGRAPAGPYADLARRAASW